MTEPIIHDGTPERDYQPPADQSTGLCLGLRGPDGYADVAERFPEELIIPDSEWQARIEEMKTLKARVSDLSRFANLPCKDQNGTNYCATADTEVLTEKGWTLWPDYNGSDLLATVNPLTHAMEYQAPIKTHVYEHDGEMVYSTNRRVDFGMTPDHRMYVRKWDQRKQTLSDQYSFIRAADLGWYFGLLAAPSGYLGTELVQVAVEGDRSYDGDDFVALIAIILSDGYAGGSASTKNWVSFCCFRSDRYQQAAALAARVGFRESPSRKGIWTRYDAGALAEWVRIHCYVSGQHIGSKSKKVPDLLKVMSGRQIKHFLSFFGDQSHTNEGRDYFSTSKRLLDDLQELLLRIGKRGNIWGKPSEKAIKCVLKETGQEFESHGCWKMSVASGNQLSIDRKKHLETDRYKGPVYCATVPNSTLITRRNGSVLISGNCWINAPTHCVEIVRVTQNQPMVILSPASAGGPIKGYRNVGGWGKEGLEWIVAHGLVPVDKWPANAINSSYHTEENKRLALKYRVTEWWELRPRSLKELISCVLRGIPVAVGYNWWGHEVTAVDAEWLDGTVALRIRNSWSMSWGDKGFGILQGSKMLPDDAVAPRVAIAA